MEFKVDPGLFFEAEYAAEEAVTTLNNAITDINNITNNIPDDFPYKTDIFSLQTSLKSLTGAGTIASLNSDIEATKSRLSSLDSSFMKDYSEYASNYINSLDLSNLSAKDRERKEKEQAFYNRNYKRDLKRYLEKEINNGNVTPEILSAYEQLKKELEIDDLQDEIEDMQNDLSKLDPESKKYKELKEKLDAKQEQATFRSQEYLDIIEQDIRFQLLDKNLTKEQRASLEAQLENIDIQREQGVINYINIRINSLDITDVEKANMQDNRDLKLMDITTKKTNINTQNQKNAKYNIANAKTPEEKEYWENILKYYEDEAEQLKLEYSDSSLNYRMRRLDPNSEEYKKCEELSINNLTTRTESINTKINELNSKDELTTQEQELLESLEYQRDINTIRIKEYELGLLNNKPVSYPSLGASHYDRPTAEEVEAYSKQYKEYTEWKSNKEQLESEIETLQRKTGTYQNKWYEDIYESVTKTNEAWDKGIDELISGEGWDGIWNAMKQSYATNVVTCNAAISGIANIGEAIYDGIYFVDGSLDAGLTWLVHDTWSDNDLAGEKMDETLDHIRVDQVGKFNEWFYEDTSLGRSINTFSTLKYDSAGAQAIESGAEFAGKVILATALTAVTGGAAAPIAIGALYGFGNKTEEYTQSVDRENGESYNYTEAILRGTAGAVSGAAEFYGYGQMGAGIMGVNISPEASTSFAKNFFVKDTILDSAAVVVDHGVNLALGDETWQQALIYGGTEFAFALGLNAIGAGVTTKAAKNANKIPTAFNRANLDIDDMNYYFSTLSDAEKAAIRQADIEAVWGKIDVEEISDVVKGLDKFDVSKVQPAVKGLDDFTNVPKGFDNFDSSLLNPKVMSNDELITAVKSEMHDPYTQIELVEQLNINKLTLEDKLLKNISDKGMTFDEYVKSCGSITQLDKSTQTIVNKFANQIYENAKLLEPSISDTILNLQEPGVRVVGFKHRFKESDSIARKIAKSIGNTTNPDDIKYFADEINDSLRYTLILDENSYSSQFYDKLNTLMKKGYEVEWINNKWGDPIYQGINVTLKSPEGLKLEVQFHTDSSYLVKESLNHKYYEIVRSSSASLEERQLATEIMKINQQLNVKTIDELVNLDTSQIIKNTKNYPFVEYTDYDKFVAFNKNYTDNWVNRMTPREKSLMNGYTTENTDIEGNYQIVNGILRDNLIDWDKRTITIYSTTTDVPNVYSIEEFEAKINMSILDYTKKQKQIAKEMNDCISRSVLQQDMVLWRGVHWNALESFGIKEGDSTSIILAKLNSKNNGVYSDDGFMSTAVVKSGTTESKPIHLKMNCKAGTPAADLHTISSFGSENEVLLGYGQEFFIDDVIEENGKIIIMLTSKD